MKTFSDKQKICQQPTHNNRTTKGNHIGENNKNLIKNMQINEGIKNKVDMKIKLNDCHIYNKSWP